MDQKPPPKVGETKKEVVRTRRFFKGQGRTRSLNLDKLVAQELTNSDSFDLRWIKKAALGKLLEAIPVPAILIDESDAIVFANTACGAIKLQSKEVRGRQFQTLFTSVDEAKRADVVVRKVFADRKPKILEGNIRFDSHKMFGRMHLRSIRVREQRLLLVLIEDLTAEKKQVLLNEKYKKLVNMLTIGIAEFGLPKPVSLDLSEEAQIALLLEAIVVDGNDEYAKIYGYNGVSEILGMKLGDLFPYTDRNKSLYKMWIRDGFPISSHEVTELLPDFGPKYVENSFIGLTKNELLISFWMIRRDVTISRKLKEESFRVQKLESLGLLAGGIAHDFNNILTGILGSIGLAKLSASPEDKLFQKLQDAEKGAWRARDLTEQLLTFSRGGAPIKKTTSLGKILAEAVPFALRGSNVKYDLHIPENIMPVEVDEGQINQVIHNLVINADQAMPTGGILSVSAENVYLSSEDGLPVSEGAYVLITVKDTGAGIPTEYLEKVFDPYFTTKQKGSGLGLAVSYSIIKGHHGFIRVESDLGRGTSFFIYLPGSDKELNLQSGSAIEELPCTGKILIMDDEAMIRDVALEMLSIKGFEVHCAKDGFEAIELYREAMDQGCRFDAIIMDLTIPGSMGGKETVAELLKMDPTVKAIVSSGYSHDPIMSQYESHGFAGVVTKPYKIENLVNALAMVINLSDCQRN